MDDAPVVSTKQPQRGPRKGVDGGFVNFQRCGMLATAAGALARFFAGAGGAAALTAGLALGWGVAVAVYALSTAYYGLREKWGLGDD